MTYDHGLNSSWFIFYKRGREGRNRGVYVVAHRGPSVRAYVPASVPTHRREVRGLLDRSDRSTLRTALLCKT